MRPLTCPGGAIPDFFNLIIAQEQELKFSDPARPGRKNPYSYNREDLKLADSNFNYNFFYKKLNGELKNPLRDMKIEGFCNFIDDLNDAGYKNDPNDDHYAALLMHIGLETTTPQNGIEEQIMQIVFEPVFFIKKNDQFEIQHTEPKKFYTISPGGGLNPLSEEDAIKNFIGPYQGISRDSEIYIIRYGKGHDPNYFLNEPNRHADVKFCMITMQQILRMYRDNYDVVHNSDEYHVPKGFIRFKFVARQLKHHPDYKLHVLAYTNIEERGSGLFKTGTYINLGADFTQMSPPNPATSVPSLEY